MITRIEMQEKLDKYKHRKFDTLNDEGVQYHQLAHMELWDAVYFAKKELENLDIMGALIAKTYSELCEQRQKVHSLHTQILHTPNTTDIDEGLNAAWFDLNNTISSIEKYMEQTNASE